MKTEITSSIHYVGVNDRHKTLFEGLWPLPYGVSYNSYIILDDKIALVDTVEVDFFPQFLDNIRRVIGGRQIDYIIVNHVEPDHSGSIALIKKYYPEAVIVGNKKTFDMLSGYYGVGNKGDILEVKQGDTLSLGHHELAFTMVPMVHWPETMVTLDTTVATLFSGDAFGCFGALSGAVIDEDMCCDIFWDEMRRYYSNIVGKYGVQVQQALKKLAGVKLDYICSTHGPVWHKHIERVVSMYDSMSRYEAEPGLVVCYGSMYGNTQRVAEAIAEGAAEAGLRRIIVHNLSVSQPSFVLADIFRYGSLAIGGPTYNGGLFPVVEDLLKRLTGRSVSQHKLGFFGGFTWSSQAVKVIDQYNEKMKMQLVGSPVEWKQGAGTDALAQARELGRLLAAE